MRSLHLGIAAKAMILIVGLCVMSALANWLSLTGIDQVDQANTILARQVSPTRVALTETKARIQALGTVTYKSLAINGRADQQTARSELDNEFKAARLSANNLLQHFPQRADDAALIAQKLDLVHQVATDVQNEIFAGEIGEAQKLLELRFDPAQSDAIFHMDRLINRLGAEAQSVLDESAASRAWTMRAILVALLIGTAATLALALAAAHWSIARPLKRLTGVMTSMARGSFDTPIEAMHRRDEVGAMARAVSVFRDNGVALKAAEEAAALTREHTARDRRAILTTIADTFEKQVLGVAAALAHAATALDRSAIAMSDTANRSDNHAQGATLIASETTQIADTVAGALDELSSAMDNIRANAVTASEIVTRASRDAHSARDQAGMLGEAVDDVDKVVVIIAAIARQTNLLALNAAIEAARAGETGRSFSVVAQEVKLLAEQTTNALTQIRSRTASMRQIATEVRETTTATFDGIAEIEHLSTAITGAVHQQSTATSAIATTVTGAAERTREVEGTIADVSDLAGRTRSGAQAMQDAVAQLTRQVGMLQANAQQFASQIRAA